MQSISIVRYTGMLVIGISVFTHAIHIETTSISVVHISGPYIAEDIVGTKMEDAAGITDVTSADPKQANAQMV